jgi:vitamin B12 transporter
MLRSAPLARFLLAATPCLPVVANAQAPPDTFRLSEMVVTATRLPLPVEAVPASITVIEGESLRRAGIRFVSAALRTVPGVHVVQSGSTGGLTSIFMRGGESDYVRVMVDGVAINDPGGSVDIANLTTDDVERIEIVRGPTSVLYGSDAAAGVIQVFTRRGSPQPRVTASAGFGRESRVGPLAQGTSPSWDVAAGVTGSVKALGYALTASRRATDGAYAFNNEYDNTTVGVRFDVAGDRTSARLTGRWADGTFHYPTNGAGEIVDANQFRSSESLVLGLEATHEIAPRIRGSLSLTTRSGDYVVDDRPDSPADSLGSYALLVADAVDRSGADLWFDIQPTHNLTVTIGASAEWQSARNSTLSQSSFGPFESASDNERRNTALYAQAIAAPVRDVTVTAGGRIDDNDRFGAFRTWRIGVNWNAARGLDLRASAGTGFKEPTFYENYATGFVTGDPGLRPERTRSVDAGIEQSLLDDRLVVGVSVFAQRFRNLIMFTFEPPADQTSNYFNVGAAEASGIEMTARWSARSGLTAALAVDWLDTNVTDQGFGSDRSFLEDRRLLRRPIRSASAAIGYATTRWNAEISIDHTGPRDDLDFSDPAEFDGVRVTLEHALTVDLAAGVSLFSTDAGTGLDLLARVENLFDETYQQIVNFPAPGRVLRLTLRTRLDP